MRRVALLIALLITAAGCRNNEEFSPTSPEGNAAIATTAAAPLSFRRIAAGDRHACALTSENLAYCWGDNSLGQLGDGTTQHRMAPVAVAGGHKFIQISGGYNYTCAVTPEFKAFCWGQNTYGKLGDGTTGTRLLPAAVQGNHSFRQIDAGRFHTCAVTTTNVAYCWGLNSNGRLGDGSTATRQLRPMPVVGDLKFRSISAGTDHTCALTPTNRPFCWGRNNSGQLGDGTTVDKWAPRHVSIRRTFIQIEAGTLDRFSTTHTCGVTTMNEAFCWGQNQAGQLGNGFTNRAIRPTAVAGSLTWKGVAVGGDHNCGLTTANLAYCWGYNYYGQLGDGSERGVNAPTRLSPYPVTGGRSFTALTVGESHSCGIAVNTRGYCWGNVLGNGTLDASSTPVSVAGPE